jgi:NADPH:quinone reductase-like Zn-dependent oxidoreductase
MGEKVQSGLTMREKGRPEVQHDLGIPSPDMGQILVRVHAVALNPSDWMSLDTVARPGAGLGYDFAGEVVEIGPWMGSRCQWAPGDRVAGFVHACRLLLPVSSTEGLLTVQAMRSIIVSARFGST